MITLGLTGYPLGHSLSPTIHAAALEYCDLQGEYNLYPVHQDNMQELGLLLEKLRGGEITGLNVTIPHKQTIIPMLDELTKTALNIGAVNTIFTRNGKLVGENTDAPGFIADLKKYISMQDNKQNNKSALILGAGGAARSVVYALINEGWRVCIAARRIEQAHAIMSHFPAHKNKLHTAELEAEKMLPLLEGLDLVVNATPVGMHPDHHTPWPRKLSFPGSAFFYDLVYNPRETQFIKDVCSENLNAVSGIGMLVEQAAMAFEKWTNCGKVQNIMYKALEEK